MNQENQPTVNQSTVTPSTVHSTRSSFLVILLSILLLISCIIAGFFAYQTQKLAKELTAYSVQITQTPTPEPTYEPGTEPESVPLEILTKDWEFFSGKNIAVSFYYPNNWGVRERYIQGANSSEIYLTKNNSKIELLKFDNSFVPGTCEDINSVKGSFTKVFNYNNELARVLVYNPDTKNKVQTWNVCFKNLNGEYIGGLPFQGYVSISVPTDPEILVEVDQILSTFKFTN